jgi:hypothetical protein
MLNAGINYLGTWNPLTNTPTLADGVGQAGDFYIATTEGTINLGSGNLTFKPGYWALQNASLIWQVVPVTQYDYFTFSIGSISNIPATGQTLSKAVTNNQNFVLPSLSTVIDGAEFVVKSLNFTGVTVEATGLDRIDNLSSQVLILPPYGSKTFVANTTTWLII